VDGINVRPSARLVFTTNNLPRFRDRSSGIWRRVIVLPFRVSIAEARQDPHLSAKLRAELPGILNWSVEGLRRLRQRERFTEPTVCQQAVDDYKAESSPGRTFLKERVQAVPTGCLPCADAYTQYRAWSKENGYEPLNERQFGKDVTRIFPSARRVKGTASAPTDVRPWVYRGIQLAAGNGSADSLPPEADQGDQPLSHVSHDILYSDNIEENIRRRE
jgi:putative DNA primase/helicase